MGERRSVGRSNCYGCFTNRDNDIAALSFGLGSPNALGLEPLVFRQYCHAPPLSTRLLTLP